MVEPALHTHVVPENWADAGISPSFIPWPDKIGTAQERLRDMDEVLGPGLQRCGDGGQQRVGG